MRAFASGPPSSPATRSTRWAKTRWSWGSSFTCSKGAGMSAAVQARSAAAGSAARAARAASLMRWRSLGGVGSPGARQRPPMAPSRSKPPETFA